MIAYNPPKGISRKPLRIQMRDRKFKRIKANKVRGK